MGNAPGTPGIMQENTAAQFWAPTVFLSIYQEQTQNSSNFWIRSHTLIHATIVFCRSQSSQGIIYIAVECLC